MWVPHPKQAIALACPAFELFFGGAKGGGKSDFLLADYARGVPLYAKEWKGVIFRRSYSELEELIERSKTLYEPMDARWTVSDATWRLPNGAVLKMRYLEKDSDLMAYQGHAYTWIGFDELTNWATDKCWTTMMGCCRSATGVPCYIRGAGNPGSIGHIWVKGRFIDPFDPMTIYLDEESQLTRAFIPSKLDDNTHLMNNDPGYENRLRAASPQLYQAYRFGDWNVIEGSAFSEFMTTTHVSETFPVPQGWNKFISMDWGYTTPFSIGFHAVDEDGRMWRYSEWYGCTGKPNVGIQMESKDVAKKLWKMACKEGILDLVMDPSCWSKRGMGKSVAQEFKDVGFRCHKGINDRANGLAEVHNRLKTQSGMKPMYMVFDDCKHFIRTVPTLQIDKNNPEDLDTKMEDHAYDDMRYAVMSRLVNRVRRESWNQVKRQYDPMNFGHRKSG
jgi:hypothetical protein